MTHRGWALGVLMILFATAVSGCLSSDDDKEVPKTGADDDSGDAMDDSMDGDHDGDAMDGEDTGGDGATAADPVAPVAAFTIGSATIVAGDEVLFDANTTTDEDTDVADLTFAWDFGDGATATGLNTTHVFAAAGVYNVTLNVTDPDGLSNVTTQTVDVISGFTPGLFGEPLTGTITAPNPVIALAVLYQSMMQPAQDPDAICENNLDCVGTLGVENTHYLLFDITVPAGSGYVKFNLPDHTANTSPLGIHVFRSDTGARIGGTGAATGNPTAEIKTPESFTHLEWTVMVFSQVAPNKAFSITAEALQAPPA